MDRIYIVGYEDVVEIAFTNRADAEEYVLATAENYLYEDYLQGYYPTFNDYAWELKIGAMGYWIESIPLRG